MIHHSQYADTRNGLTVFLTPLCAAGKVRVREGVRLPERMRGCVKKSHSLTTNFLLSVSFSVCSIYQIHTGRKIGKENILGK